MQLENTGILNFIKIPDIISSLNMIFGFIAILMAFNNYFTLSAICIIIAIIFDSIDGWVARKLGRDDSLGFGKNIDSLADIVSFGAAPAALLYSIGMKLSPNMQILTAIISLYMIWCGLLRLTRFNVIGDKIDYQGFIGFPIPGIAFLLATFYLTGFFNIWVAYILMIITATLMISNLKYPKIDNYILIGISFILILLIPLKLALYGINIPALILFIFVLIYLFLNFYYNINQEGSIFKKTQ
ncbi:MAG: archaetidylserine synthase [Methanobacteriaceae archaeon]|nr:archaetidylserine synthase [Methanobacteriaceae archaeon]